TATGVPVGHSSAIAPESSVTGSENVIWTVLLTATSVAPSVGVVLDTVGATSAVGELTGVSAGGWLGGAAGGGWGARLGTHVSTQCAPGGRSELGVNVKLVAGEELTLYACGVPVGHSSVNELVVAVTDSEKLTVRVVLVATSVAPSAGEVVVTAGAVSVVN